MKIYVCEDCGQELVVKYTGLPDNQKARIVSSHSCDAPDEFVQNLNDLPSGKFEEVEETSSEEPGDRRDDEHTKSTAPPGLAESLGVPDNLPEEDEAGRQEPTGFPGTEEKFEGSEE